MCGNNVFYPMGWDDNGLPTERRVQELFNVRCDRQLPYQPDFAPVSGSDQVQAISRRNFLELCAMVAREDEGAFEDLWRRLGLSVDWSLSYATNDELCRRISQMAFLDLVRKGEAHSADAPVTWDVDFQTAVAQAESEDREIEGLEFRLRFGIEGGGGFEVMTTRPELLAACVAVVVHPDDGRHRSLVGRTAITPGYRARVPIVSHHLAEADKGTGAVMVCTFGDATDVLWWQELGLPSRMILGRDGRICPVEWGSDEWQSLYPETARRVHGQITGLSVKDARRRMAEILSEPSTAPGDSGRAPLVGGPWPVMQIARFYEKGARPLEILLTRQWFVRLLDKKEALLEQGRKINWHPQFMRTRYERWVEGLKYDWCLSRQRYLGVPVPVWYPLDEQGEPAHDTPLLPDDGRLPVDPQSEAPCGYVEAQRDSPGGFTAESDVLDTWATSSLTPRIPTGWAVDEEKFAALCPMNMRPQAHEIIRTWAFYTIARAYLLDGSIPWRNAVISGWVLDPERKKMSKSRGRAVTPAEALDAYGVDAVRYWAASGSPGTDTAFDESVFKVGRRLAIKLFNAGKLIVGRLRSAGASGELSIGDVTRPLDRSHVALLLPVVREATEAMECFETAKGLQAIEAWFWSNLCDNYLELTKERAYSGDRSALATWSLSLSTALRLFAPFLPYVTEEIWSWHHGADGVSVHRAPWPTTNELSAACGDTGVVEAAVEVLTQIRRWKTETQRSLKTPVERATIQGPAGRLALLRSALADVRSAGRLCEVQLRPGVGKGLSVRLQAQ
jgi:valyl-tRNA synthetase